MSEQHGTLCHTQGRVDAKTDPAACPSAWGAECMNSLPPSVTSADGTPERTHKHRQALQSGVYTHRQTHRQTHTHRAASSGRNPTQNTAEQEPESARAPRGPVTPRSLLGRETLAGSAQAEVRDTQAEDQGSPALPNSPAPLAALARLDFPAGLSDSVFDLLGC